MPLLSRRSAFGCLAAGVYLAALFSPSFTRAELAVVGADLSALKTLEDSGAVFRSGGQPGDALGILRERGANCFRLRLFVTPNGEELVTNDLDYTVALARRIKASGARWMLDIHYSDTWADPSKQFKPAAWAHLSFEDLVRTVHDYTREVVTRFHREHLSPDFIQLGNEITNGMLWPDGKVEFGTELDTAEAWGRFLRLLRAARDGVKAAGITDRAPQIILHIESSRQPDRSIWFFQHIIEAGISFDFAGFSYYPEWHGGIDQLRATLDQVAKAFHKPIMVVEVSYPWRSDTHWDGRPHLDWPLTPEGQQAFLRDVIHVLRELPEGLGTGLFYWHPESVPVAGRPTWLGGSCALFDPTGQVLPAASFAREALGLSP